MIVREVLPEEKEQFNKVVTHPLQSWEWGEFRKKTGVEVVRFGFFEGNKLKAGAQLTFHKLPKTNFTVGYLPKCLMPDEYLLETLKKFGNIQKSIFIKIEPNVGGIYRKEQAKLTSHQEVEKFLLPRGCLRGRPLFTKYSFRIDLNQNEETLMAKMKQKTRYNVRLAQKKGVIIQEDNSPQAFEEYLKLTFQTAKRQQFYTHDENYHRKMWETLQPAGIAHLLKATYMTKTLVVWILFIFNGVLYYPYGASSREYPEVMASNLMMWEAIRFGKKLGCKTFDLWGSLGPDPDPKDPWLGFHRFKEGYGPDLIEFIGTFDLVLNEPIYKIYNILDSLRWKYLKLKAIFLR